MNDICNCLLKLSKNHNMCIINNLSLKNKTASLRSKFEPRNKFCKYKKIIFVEENLKMNPNESQYKLVDCANQSKSIALCDTKLIIHLVLGDDYDQILEALNQKPDSHYIFFNVSVFIFIVYLSYFN